VSSTANKCHLLLPQTFQDMHEMLAAGKNKRSPPPPPPSRPPVCRPLRGSDGWSLATGARAPVNTLFRSFWWWPAGRTPADGWALVWAGGWLGGWLVLKNLYCPEPNFQPRPVPPERCEKSGGWPCLAARFATAKRWLAVAGSIFILCFNENGCSEVLRRVSAATSSGGEHSASCAMLYNPNPSATTCRSPCNHAVRNVPQQD
jgi:hypothetical protein